MSLITDLIGTAASASNPVTGIIDAAHGFLGLFKLDPNKKADIEAQLTAENLDAQKTELAAQLAVVQGQLSINLQEAKNNTLFDDWRDAVGWTCAIALFWNYVGQPFGVDLLLVFHRAIDIALIPKLDMTSLFTLLGTMLGTGASQFHLNGNGHS